MAIPDGTSWKREPLDVMMRKINPLVGGKKIKRSLGGWLPDWLRTDWTPEMYREVTPGRGPLGAPTYYDTNTIPKWMINYLK